MGLADSIEDFIAIRLVGCNFKKLFDHWRVSLAGIIERSDDNTLDASFVRQLRHCDAIKVDIAHLDSVEKPCQAKSYRCLYLVCEKHLKKKSDNRFKETE